MVFPQVLAPILIVFGVPALNVVLTFLARFTAMHVVHIRKQFDVLPSDWVIPDRAMAQSAAALASELSSPILFTHGIETQ